jgi:hypothetical protein
MKWGDVLADGTHGTSQRVCARVWHEANEARRITRELGQPQSATGRRWHARPPQCPRLPVPRPCAACRRPWAILGGRAGRPAGRRAGVRARYHRRNVCNVCHGATRVRARGAGARTDIRCERRLGQLPEAAPKTTAHVTARYMSTPGVGEFCPRLAARTPSVPGAPRTSTARARPGDRLGSPRTGGTPAHRVVVPSAPPRPSRLLWDVVEWRHGTQARVRARFRASVRGPEGHCR